MFRHIFVSGQDGIIFWYFGHGNCDYKAPSHSWKTLTFPLKSCPEKKNWRSQLLAASRKTRHPHPPSNIQHPPSTIAQWGELFMLRHPSLSIKVAMQMSPCVCHTFSSRGLGRRVADSRWCGLLCLCPQSLFCLIKRKLSVRFGCSLPIRHALLFFIVNCSTYMFYVSQSIWWLKSCFWLPQVK